VIGGTSETGVRARCEEMILLITAAQSDGFDSKQKFEKKSPVNN